MLVDVEAMLTYCLDKPGAWPDNPWGHEHPVIKVGPGESGKIFAFLSQDRSASRAVPAARRPMSGCSATRTTRR